MKYLREIILRTGIIALLVNLFTNIDMSASNAQIDIQRQLISRARAQDSITTSPIISVPAPTGITPTVTTPTVSAAAIASQQGVVTPNIATPNVETVTPAAANQALLSTPLIAATPTSPTITSASQIQQVPATAPQITTPISSTQAPTVTPQVNSTSVPAVTVPTVQVTSTPVAQQPQAVTTTSSIAMPTAPASTTPINFPIAKNEGVVPALPLAVAPSVNNIQQPPTLYFQPEPTQVTSSVPVENTARSAASQASQGTATTDQMNSLDLSERIKMHYAAMEDAQGKTYNAETYAAFGASLVNLFNEAVTIESYMVQLLNKALSTPLLNPDQQAYVRDVMIPNFDQIDEKTKPIKKGKKKKKKSASQPTETKAVAPKKGKRKKKKIKTKGTTQAATAGVKVQAQAATSASSDSKPKKAKKSKHGKKKKKKKAQAVPLENGPQIMQ